MIFVELQSQVKSTILNEGDNGSDSNSDLTVFETTVKSYLLILKTRLFQCLIAFQV